MNNKSVEQELIKSCKEQGYSFLDMFENFDILLKIQNNEVDKK